MEHPDNPVVRKSTPLGGKVWASLLIFGFVGQMAWMVENVYFATFIQKNITAAGWATSATVAASAVAAALATIFSAAWSDRVGRRRIGSGEFLGEVKGRNADLARRRGRRRLGGNGDGDADAAAAAAASQGGMY